MPTYDPQAHAKQANVLRQPGLMTPSERRKFADEKRKRLSELGRRQWKLINNKIPIDKIPTQNIVEINFKRIFKFRIGNIDE